MSTCLLLLYKYLHFNLSAYRFILLYQFLHLNSFECYYIKISTTNIVTYSILTSITLTNSNNSYSNKIYSNVLRFLHSL